MCKEMYDITEGDLNPEFFFTCVSTRTEEEENYHAHDFIEFAVIMGGRGRFYIDGKNYEVEEGDLILLNPGTYHRSRAGYSKEGLKECYIGFSKVSFKGCESGYFPLFKNNQKIMKMTDKMKKNIFQICNAMNKEARECGAGRYFMLKAYLIQALCMINREQREEKQEGEGKGYIFQSTGKKYVVQQIMKYMEENYQEKISLEQIAANMYLSSFYIAKIFKSETGDTPINYLIRLRMEKAKEILEISPEEPIKEVAAAVGYSDAYHFSKLFKKHYGISPLYYKKESFS